MLNFENKNTTILATMGPTLQTVEEIVNAAKSDVTALRLALSSRERDVCEYISNVREAEIKVGHKIDVLIDFPASRPRTAELQDIELIENEMYVLSGKKCKDKNSIEISGLDDVIEQLNLKDHIYMRDGKIKFRIEYIDLLKRKIYAICTLASVELRSNCSCVFPDTDLTYSPVVPLDIKALERLKENNLVPDWFAASFAVGRESVTSMQKLAESFWPAKKIKIMAKIENRSGIEKIDEILGQADGIMVARGDLLLHIDPVTLPKTQEYLVEKAVRAKKVSVIATEFLEIYAKSGVINRAELSDIALGARQKATALMLSMESANSEHSKECIELMSAVIKDNEIGGRF